MGMFKFTMGAITRLLSSLLTDGTLSGMAALILATALGVAVTDRLRWKICMIE